jgi:DNA-binding response OmpR family regulator
MAGLRRKIEAEPAQPMFLMTETGICYRFNTDENYHRLG